jgi:hypothetical protein
VDLAGAIMIASMGMMLAVDAHRRWNEPRRRVRRALRAMSESPIGSIEDGARVRISGVVAIHRDTMVSPVDWRVCLGFELAVARKSRAKPQENFVVLSRRYCQPFVVVDPSGRAVIEGPFLLALGVDDAPWVDLPPAAYPLLQEDGVSLTSALLSHRLKFEYRETVLQPGDRVTLVGRAAVEIDPAGTSTGHRALPRLCRIRGDARAPVMIARADGPPGP